MGLLDAVIAAGFIGEPSKKRYSELLSQKLALEVAAGLRAIGFPNVKPCIIGGILIPRSARTSLKKTVIASKYTCLYASNMPGSWSADGVFSHRHFFPLRRPLPSWLVGC
jgi:hypothetical protein